MANEVEKDIRGKTWFGLLQNGSVSLYWKESVWRHYIEALRTEGFDVYEFNCSNWNTIDDFHANVATILNFPGYYGCNLDAFNDCLSDCVPKGDGIALAFKQFDSFEERFPKAASAILDIVQLNSWRFLIFRHKLVALVQSDNPRIRFDDIGTMPAIWNPKEWMNKNRGL
jgi:RNAse (barnase) inhibitor barstar